MHDFKINNYRQFLSSRSGDSDLDQLAYRETRCACRKTLQQKIEMEGVPIIDGPSLELESGNQRGGHYYCSGLKIHADHTEFDRAFPFPYITFQERQEMVLKGRLALGLQRSLALHPKPFAILR